MSQIAAVAKVIKGRFPNLTTEETITISENVIAAAEEKDVMISHDLLLRIVSVLQEAINAEEDPESGFAFECQELIRRIEGPGK